MPNTYKKIATVVVGSGGSSAINFTSIPQTYTDLKIVLSGRSLQGNVYGGGRLEFNLSTNNYSWRRLYGSGSSTASDNSTSANSITNWDMVGANATASVFSNIEFYIPNYTSSNYKSVSVDYVGENNATEAYSGMVAGLWSDTSAITSIKLYSGGGNLVQHTTATLYGIGDVTASKFAKAVGGVITYDANYVYHTYPYSGNFTPNTALTCDYLVIAGGGGGGNGRGGGGGAGGYRNSVTGETTGGGGSAETALILNGGTTYTVTVGSGGAKGPTTDTQGSDGVNSSISGTGITTLTATGGGGGGSYNGVAGRTGGSGGGAGGGLSGSAVNGGSAASPTQGYRGGNISTTNTNGTGGGGAGAQGADIGGSGSGNGGNGLSSSITGIAVTRAGGGGGGGDDSSGTGGTGGGGNGIYTPGQTAGSGTVNTGSGGGGSRWAGGGGTAGNGGSGIVIIRYPR